MFCSCGSGVWFAGNVGRSVVSPVLRQTTVVLFYACAAFPMFLFLRGVLVAQDWAFPERCFLVPLFRCVRSQKDNMPFLHFYMPILSVAYYPCLLPYFRRMSYRTRQFFGNGRWFFSCSCCGTMRNIVLW